MIYIYLKDPADKTNPSLMWRLFSEGSIQSSDAGKIFDTHSGSLEDFLSFYENITSDTFKKKNRLASFDITLIIPGEWVTYAAINIPSGNGRKIKAAIPYLVEEFLVGSIEDTQISAGSRDESGMIKVGLIKKGVIDIVSHLLKKHNLRIKSIFSFQDILPIHPYDLKAVIWNGRFLVKSKYVSFDGDLDNFDLLSNNFRASQIKNIQICYDEKNKKHLQLVTRFKHDIEYTDEISVDLFPYSGDIFDLIDKKPAPDSLDLAVDYSVQNASFGGLSFNLLPIIYAISFLLTMQIAFNLYTGFILNKESDSLINKAKESYHKSFPGESISDIQSGWSNKLSSVKNSDIRRSFGYLFSSLSISISENSAADSIFKIQNFKFDEQDNQLKVSIEAKSISDLESVKASLRDYGIDMRIVSANEEGSLIKALVLLEPL